MRTILPEHLSTPARDRDTALRARYDRAPESAWSTHIAWTETAGADARDASRGTVQVGLDGTELGYALERRVGGPHDDLGPRDLFCASIAACFDSTIRMVAGRLGIGVEKVTVVVTGDVDARGVLGDAAVPSGFQSLRVHVDLRLAGGDNAAIANRIIEVASRRSVLLETLRNAIPVEIVELPS